MYFGLKRDKPFFSNLEEQLAVVPVRNEHVELREGTIPGSLVVTTELKYGWLSGLSSLFGARRKKEYAISDLSLEMYQALDGKRCVGDLMDLIMEEHRLTFFEARGLVVDFLHRLIQRRLVVIGVKSAGSEGGN